MRSSRNQSLPSRLGPERGATPLFWGKAIYITIALISSASYSLLPIVSLAPSPVHAVSQASVTIIDYEFQPLHINITTGTTVVWTYVPNGGSQHTVTSLPNTNTTQNGGPLLNSGLLYPGQGYRYTFYQPGFYPYECSVHPTIFKMNSAWLNVTGPPMTPPSTQTPLSGFTLLIIVGAGVGAAVAVTAVGLAYRRRIRGKSAASTSAQN